MKLRFSPLLLLPVLPFAGTAFCANDAQPPSYAERVAITHLKSHVADSELDPVLLKIGIGPGKKHDEITALVKTMRAVLDEGVAVESEAFWALLKPGAPAITASTTDTAKPAPATATQTAAAALWQRGVKALNTLPPSRRERLLAFNHISESPATPSSSATGEPTPLPPFDQAILNGPPASFAKPSATATSTDRLNSFLIRIGYEARLDDATKGAEAPAATDKQAADQHGANGVITPPSFNADAKLRNAGISFATGVGIIHHRDGSGGDASAGTIVARWNLIQRYATARWNQRVGERNLDGYGLVSSYGNIEFRSAGLRGWPFGNGGKNPYSKSYSAAARDDSLWPNLTFIGPFFGSTILGDKIREPGTVAADNKYERPYLVGLSLGWGFYDEASSLAYLDFGKTISPHRGAEGSRTYFGISFDAVVFSKILSGIRSTAANSAAQ